MPEPFLVFLAEYAKRQKAKGKQVSEPLLRLLESGILEAGVPEGEASLAGEDRAAGGEASLAPLASQKAQEGAPPGGARVEEPSLSPRASEALQEAQEAASRFVQRSMEGTPKAGSPVQEVVREALSRLAKQNPPLDLDRCTPAATRPETRPARAKEALERRVAELVKGTPLEELYRKDPEATPFRLLRALVALALSSAHERGYKVKGLSQVTFHLPVELLAKALGIDRTTLWRNLAPLEEAGLVATARHLGQLDGRVATTGTIWAVVLQPGRRARLHYEDLAHPWRDLDLDRKQGKTAFNVLKAVKKGFRITFRFLLDWALGRRPTPWSPPPTGSELEDILSLPGVAPQERPDLIDRLSATIARKLGDPGSRRYYAGLLWRVVEGQLRPEALLTLIRRAMAAIGEGVARPGALVAQALGRL